MPPAAYKLQGPEDTNKNSFRATLKSSRDTSKKSPASDTPSLQGIDDAKHPCDLPLVHSKPTEGTAKTIITAGAASSVAAASAASTASAIPATIKTKAATKATIATTVTTKTPHFPESTSKVEKSSQIGERNERQSFKIGSESLGTTQLNDTSELCTAQAVELLAQPDAEQGVYDRNGLSPSLHTEDEIESQCGLLTPEEVCTGVVDNHRVEARSEECGSLDRYTWEESLNDPSMQETSPLNTSATPTLSATCGPLGSYPCVAEGSTRSNTPYSYIYPSPNSLHMQALDSRSDSIISQETGLSFMVQSPPFMNHETHSETNCSREALYTRGYSTDGQVPEELVPAFEAQQNEGHRILRKRFQRSYSDGVDHHVHFQQESQPQCSLPNRSELCWNIYDNTQYDSQREYQPFTWQCGHYGEPCNGFVYDTYQNLTPEQYPRPFYPELCGMPAETYFAGQSGHFAFNDPIHFNGAYIGAANSPFFLPPHHEYLYGPCMMQPISPFLGMAANQAAPQADDGSITASRYSFDSGATLHTTHLGFQHPPQLKTSKHRKQSEKKPKRQLKSPTLRARGASKTSWKYDKRQERLKQRPEQGENQVVQGDSGHGGNGPSALHVEKEKDESAQMLAAGDLGLNALHSVSDDGSRQLLRDDSLLVEPEKEHKNSEKADADPQILCSDDYDNKRKLRKPGPKQKSSKPRRAQKSVSLSSRKPQPTEWNGLPLNQPLGVITTSEMPCQDVVFTYPYFQYNSHRGFSEDMSANGNLNYIWMMPPEY